MKKILVLIGLFLLTFIYLFPIARGLIILPLDLLVSNYGPWNLASQIFIKNSYVQDSIIQLYPWKHLVFESLGNGIIPFWNPYQFLGMPFMAAMKPMVFYPLNILDFLGAANGWNALLFSQIFLSLIFSYLLARDFKLSLLPSLLVSFAFSLNTLMIGILEFGAEGHVILWIPLFILCAKKFLEEQKGRYLFFLGTAIGISVFAGQLQYTGYALMILSGFILFYGFHLKTGLKIYMQIFLSMALGIGISFIQLIPSLELASNSVRGSVSSFDLFSNDLVKTQQLFRLFAPDLFGHPATNDLTLGYIETSGYFGITTLFFAIYAMIFSRKNIFVNFFTITFLISMLLSLQGIGLLLYLFKIPILTSGSGARIFSLTLFSGAILSGFGLSDFIKSKNLKLNLKAIIIFLAVFILIMLGSALGNYFSNSLSNFIHNIQFVFVICALFISGTIIFLFFREKNKNLTIIFLIFIVLLTYLDLFRSGYRFLTFSNKKFLYPETKISKFVKEYSQKTLERNIGLTGPEIETYFNIYSVETYNSLYLRRTAELLNALQNKQIDWFPINKYSLARDINLKYALDFLGVSSFVSGIDNNPSITFFSTANFQGSLTAIYKDDKYIVYKNKDAYPRFELFYDVQTIKNDNEILNLISKRTFDFRHKLILEEDLPITLEKGTGSAKLLSAGLNNQKFAVETNKPALFYISDTYFPGWSAKINNKESKIYQANYNFRAVLVPTGKSILEFSYEPTNFRISVWLSIFSLLGLVIISKFAWKPGNQVK